MSPPVAVATAATPSLVPPFEAEHEELREAVHRLVDNEIRPHVAEWEQAGWFPNAVFERLGELGLLGLRFPEELGGQGGTHVHEAVLLEELARCGSLGVFGGVGGHMVSAMSPIAALGTGAQRRRYLPAAIRGESIGAIAITEPDAGSDIANIRTRAQRTTGGFVVNGAKLYITNGVRASFLVTAVRSEEQPGHRGLSLVIIDTDVPGVSVSRKLDKLGWHASDTAGITFEDVFVAEDGLLGATGTGFAHLMDLLQWERLGLCLGAIGAMAECFERTVAFARQRRAFGRPIGAHQAVAHRIADMRVRLATARALTYDALRRFEIGEDAVEAISVAKLVSQRANMANADDAVQIHGGAGYMREYEIERFYRDSRLGPIGGGTDEMLKDLLARRSGVGAAAL